MLDVPDDPVMETAVRQKVRSALWLGKATTPNTVEMRLDMNALLSVLKFSDPTCLVSSDSDVPLCQFMPIEMLNRLENTNQDEYIIKAEYWRLVNFMFYVVKCANYKRRADTTANASAPDSKHVCWTFSSTGPSSTISSFPLPRPMEKLTLNRLAAFYRIALKQLNSNKPVN